MFANELSYLNHIIAREITNGMWFLASMFLVASMVRFIAPRLIQQPMIWRQGVDVRLAWGILLIAAGTALRAGWIWALLIANSLASKDAVAFLERLGWISYLAIGLGVWGAVCSVKAITEAANASHTSAYLWGYWIFVALATIMIPLAVNLML